MKKIILMLLVCWMHGVVVGQETNRLLNNEDSIPNEFTYVNAISFDFGNTKSSTSYLGHLNYFFNVTKNGSNSKHYLNTGLLKSNYYSAEINEGSYNQVDNVLENPNDPTSPGSTYNKEFNKYDISVKLNTFSGYFQYLYKISKINSLFVHLHGELMISNYETNVKITTISSSQETIPSTDIIPISNYINKDNTFTKQNIGGYFGGGLTAKMKFDFGTTDSTKINYFLQGTTGISNTQLNPKLYPSSSNNLPLYEENNGAKPFYIIHSYFENNITGIKLIIGGHIRGNYATAPLYNFYVGINTNLDNLKKVFE